MAVTKHRPNKQSSVKRIMYGGKFYDDIDDIIVIKNHNGYTAWAHAITYP